MEKDFKSGFVTIVGRPNVGKSTLMNKLIGQKISIISDKPQTTRNTIKTVLTNENYQVVFIDTPGIHKPESPLGEYMIKSAKGTLEDVDLILFMTTPDENMGTGDKFIIEQFKNIKTPVILIVNKIDEASVTKEKLIKTLANYNEQYEFEDVIPISALTGENIDKLTDVLYEKLPVGPKYFPDDVLTDQSERFIVAEIIREKALYFLEQEVPHGIAVEITQMKEDSEESAVYIDATIYCEKDSHKGIIIGKNGQMLKKIKTLARKDIRRLLGVNVHLELWVKVKKNWRDDKAALRNFGYK